MDISENTTADQIGFRQHSHTQNEHLRPSPHCGHTVRGGALPPTLMVLCRWLKQQGAIQFNGVRRVTHQVDLSERPELVKSEQTLYRSA